MELQNFPLPSTSTLKRYIPEYTFKSYDNKILQEIFKGMQENNISPEMIISWDEMEIRSGLVYCKQQNKIVGFVNDLAKDATILSESQTPIVPTNIAKKISQFFLISIDGKATIPILHCGTDESNFTNFLVQQIIYIKELVHTLCPDNYKVHLIGECSDGAPGNLTFANQYAKNIIINYLHFDDFSHLTKRMRNVLLSVSQSMIIDKEVVQFNIHTLILNQQNTEIKKLLSDGNIVAPSDCMDMEPVLKLLDCRIRDFLSSQQNKDCQALGWYLNWMNSFYHLFRNHTESADLKLKTIANLLSTLKSWKVSVNSPILKESLYEELVITLDSTEKIIKRFGDKCIINFCSLSTLMVEHYFSFIRYKIKKPSAIEYSMLSSVSFIRLKAVLAESSPWSLQSRALSKCYNNVDVKLPYIPLQVRKKSDAIVTTPEIEEFAQNIGEIWKPKTSLLLIREFFFKNPPQDDHLKNRILLLCPLASECNHFFSFTYHKALLNHLIHVHKLNITDTFDKFSEALQSAIENTYGGIPNIKSLIGSTIQKTFGTNISSVKNRNDNIPKEEVLLWNSTEFSFTSGISIISQTTKNIFI